MLFRRGNLHNIISLWSGAAVFAGVLVLLFVFFLAMASPALALDIQVSKGDTTVSLGSYSDSELSAMGSVQQYYSSIDGADAPLGIIAQGLPVNTLLAALDIPISEVESLRFASSDGWSRSFSAADYLSGRYYYPQIVAAYDETADELPAFAEGAEDGRQEVGAMLALSYAEQRYEAKPDSSLLSGSYGIRFCFGQRAVSEKVSLNFGKYINSLTIVMKNGSSYILPEQDSDSQGGNGSSGSQVDPATDTPISQIPASGLAEVLDTQGLMADTLTITVGYYGGDYYTKKVFTLDELAALADISQIYSYLDAMPAPCLDAAKGVKLTTVLKEAGIDVNSVQSFHFYCADVSRTWYTTMTKTYLLDTPRYYYPNLSKNWDYENTRATTGATVGAKPVSAILALQDKWRRFATESDFSGLTDTTRFRLVFGQPDVTTAEGTRSAKWIHTIAVTLSGTPPKGITLDAAMLEMEVGSSYQVNATVERVDETTDTRVIWSSSDTSVATVDKHGNITVIGEGQAVITATTVVGGLSASVIINGSGEADGAAEGGTLGGEEGTPGSGAVYRISLGGGSGEAEAEATVNWRSDPMSPDAVALAEAAVDPHLMLGAGIALTLLFGGGVLIRCLIYLREV